jgi:NAD+ synthase/NAD+ synthase (glutamine-hydrolysing)
MRIAIAQTNSTVGDLRGNADRMIRFARDAAEVRADVVVFPELSLPGYPPRDLLEKRSFLERTEGELQRLAERTGALPLTLICGTVKCSDSATGNLLYNNAVVLRQGEAVFEQTKMLLPTYDVFDESRYFEPAKTQSPLPLEGIPIALTVCEDAWNDKQYWERRLYSRDPVEELFHAGAKLLISINASPWHMGKRQLRRDVFATTARRFHTQIVYVNQVGGDDQLLFDGSSFAMLPDGAIAASAASFQEDLVLFDTATGKGDRHENLPDECEAAYEALAMGTRDYIRKCGFSRVLIGLSGGIDSSLTAAIAVDAVGRENVTGVAMPGPYSSDHSIADACALAGNLGIRLEIVSINAGYASMLDTLAPLFADFPQDATEENIQSRLRGLTLMGLSNKWGAIVLTTGNKSELAVGYCTLYGDMCGGLAVISDVPKTLVYELSRVANRRHDYAIPERVFTKPPSAELRPDQKDSDSLPPYEVLDPILKAYIEEYRSPQDIAALTGSPVELVRNIINKVDRNEYKRQQAAPGLKVTSKAFGIGRRFPIAQRFAEE